MMAPPKKKYLVVVAGPTGVGKTMVAAKLARIFNTHVINADSRQVFRDLRIGTARPTHQKIQGVQHYFVGTHSLDKPFNAGIFEEEALKICEKVFADRKTLILSGGSGLYIDALCDGLDEMPKAEPDIRDKLIMEFEEKGLDSLSEELKREDPEYYGRVDIKNPQRIIRALEVIRSTGQLYSSFRTGQVRRRFFESIKIGLQMDRAGLNNKINTRVNDMLHQGLLEEVERLRPYRNHNALQTVGYQELFDYLDGRIDYEGAVELIKHNTRRYAKRQMTWFQKYSDYTWFHPEQIEQIENHVRREMRSS